MRRYGDLIYKISLQITGDRSICDPEDNQADLYIAAIDSFRGFCNQPANKSKGYTPKDCLEDPGFNQYTKTVLWHKKCNKGNKVEKKRHINNTLSLDYESPNEGKAFKDTLELTSQDYVTEETIDNLLEELNEPANKREVEKYRKHFQRNATL